MLEDGSLVVTDRLGRRRLGRWCLLIQPPRIAAFFQLGDDVIGECVTLVLTEPFLQTAYDLARAPECVCNRIPKDFSSVMPD